MQLSAENDQQETPDRAGAWWSQVNDAAMDYVLAALRPIVEAGGATLRLIDGGVLELRLLTGETVHFDAAGMTRIV